MTLIAIQRVHNSIVSSRHRVFTHPGSKPEEFEVSTTLPVFTHQPTSPLEAYVAVFCSWIAGGALHDILIRSVTLFDGSGSAGVPGERSGSILGGPRK